MSDDINVNSSNSVDDEISLLDLLAVLVRYRKFIAIFTGIIALCAIVVLFVLPKFVPSLDTKKYEVQYKIMTAELPGDIVSALSLASNKDDKNIIRSYAKENFLNLQFFASEYKKYPVFSSDLDKIDEYSYNNMVSKFIQNKSVDAKLPLANDYFVFIIVPKAENLKVADDLVKDMTKKTDELLKNIFLSRIDDLKKNTELSIEKLQKSFSTVTDMSSIAQMQNLIMSIDSFNSRYQDFVYINEEPFVINQAQGRAKKLIIVVFAAFFVSIFIAFARNAVENIKKDPEANKLMTDAWNAGK